VVLELLADHQQFGVEVEVAPAQADGFAAAQSSQGDEVERGISLAKRAAGYASLGFPDPRRGG
jgi:hypothetical protein